MCSFPSKNVERVYVGKETVVRQNSPHVANFKNHTEGIGRGSDKRADRILSPALLAIMLQPGWKCQRLVKKCEGLIENEITSGVVESRSRASKLIAENGTDRNTLVRTQVIQHVNGKIRECDERNSLDRALRIDSIVVTRAGNSLARTQEMDLAVRVGETEVSPGNDGDDVRFVVDANEVGDLQIYAE